MNKDDIKYLANLSRLELSDDEVGKYATEFDEILHYVDKIKEFSFTEDQLNIQNTTIKNVFRDDENIQESGIYTEDILNEAPQRQDDFVKVKKILNND